MNGRDDEPSVEDYIRRLVRAGWWLSEQPVWQTDGRLAWLVMGPDGTPGGEVIAVVSGSRDGAWRAAFERARALGLLADP